jgi:hypothetical protein
LRFTVHQPGQRPASPRGHGTPCRDSACCDVFGRVHVSVARVVAGDAHEQRLALATVRSDIPTRRATLAGERWINLGHSTWSLVFQAGNQESPTRGQDRPVQPGLLPHVAAGALDGAFRGPGHVPDFQILDPDQIEPARQTGGSLLHPILAPSGLPGFQPGDGGLDPTPPVRTALGTGEHTLQTQQPALLTDRRLWTRQQLASGQSSRDNHTPVHPDDLAIARSGNRLRDHRERDMPPAHPITRHPIRLHSGRNRTTPPEPHPANLGHPHPTSTPIELPHMLRPDSDLPETFVATGLTPRRFAMRTPKELRHRLGEIPQRLLLHRLRTSPQPRTLGTRLSQLSRLLHIVGRRPPTPLPMRMLLYGQVPHEPGMPTMRQQPHLLVGCRKQPVTGHPTNIVEQTFDMSATRRSAQRDRLAPCLNAGYRPMGCR